MSELEAAADRLLQVFALAERLEREQRAQSDDAVSEPLVAFGGAVLRMRIRPRLAPGPRAADPAFLAFCGTTNSGKSTLANLLIGRAAAGMKVTARYSQHPEAFFGDHVSADWLGRQRWRFAGYELFEDRHPPRQSDDDLTRRGYQPALGLHRLVDVARIADGQVADGSVAGLQAVGGVLAHDVVVLDVPDFSTEAAQYYMSAVLDSLALADVVLMPVTRESYADDRGCAMYRMLTGAGAVVCVVANMVGDEPELLADMDDKLAQNYRGTSADRPETLVRPLPAAIGETPERRLLDLQTRPQATTLAAAVAADLHDPEQLHRRVLRGQLRFLDEHLDDILAPLAREAEVEALWSETVQTASRRLTDGYRTQYLGGAKYQDFRLALVRLMELLRVPVVGEIVHALGEVVRTPMRWAWSQLRSRLGKKPPPQAPEEEVLESLFKSWLETLKGEAQSHAQRRPHECWDRVLRNLDSASFLDKVLDGFTAAYQDYREKVDQETRRRAEKIYEYLAQRPAWLNTLRAFFLATNVAAVGLSIKSGGLNIHDVLVGPLVAGFWDSLVKLGAAQVLEFHERQLKEQQAEWLSEIVSSAMSRPVRELGVGIARREQIASARHDLDRIREALEGEL